MPGKVKNRFLLLYGSQTGQAQAISEEIAEKSESNGLVAEIQCISQTEKKFSIERENCVVFVISTTGDGDPPDTALKLMRRLKKKTLPENYLSHLNFTLLGLGDSNYTTFCNCGKSLDKVLASLGAKHFYPPGWADDAVGLEVVADPWIDGLWPALQNFLGIHCDSINMSEVNRSNVDCDSRHNHGEFDSITDCQPPICNTVMLSENNCVPQSDESTSNEESSRTTDVKQHISPTCDNDSGNVTNTKSNSTSSLKSDERTTQSAVSSNGDTSHHAAPSDIQKDLQKADVCDSISDLSSQASDGCIPDIRSSVPPLSDCALSIPLAPPPFLNVEFSRELLDEKELKCIPLQNGAPFPSAQSDVVLTTVQSAEILTADDAVKKALKIRLDIKDRNIKYLPGDAISVICPNRESEIQELLERLSLSSKSNERLIISVKSDTKKRNAAIPPHLNPTSTLHHLLKTCVDIREPPKKALLRLLVEYTSDEDEKRRLQELCSKQGATDYTKFIREAALSILDVFNVFRTCLPPIERLLEHLPRLQPRPYSICSSQLTTPNSLEIVFNIVVIPAGSGRTSHRQGLCTGWINSITEAIQQKQNKLCTIDQQMSTLSIMPPEQIPIFTRTNQHFHSPEDISTPIVMIGPGTGVAPYIGFLHHREQQRKLSPSVEYGESWLFYGCRHAEKDYLFKADLEKFLENGVLSKLCICFSRDVQPEGSPRYVQDNLRLYAKEITRLLSTENTVFFVCGDARHMARDVHETFIEILQKEKGLSTDDAKSFMMQLKLHRRYLEDVWT